MAFQRLQRRRDRLRRPLSAHPSVPAALV